jgi:hypothetical protein
LSNELIRESWCEAQFDRSGINTLVSTRNDNVLNQRIESKRDGRVADFAAAKNKFIIRLRSKVPADRFESAAPRYADK